MFFWIILFLVNYFTQSIVFEFENANHNLNKFYNSLLTIICMMAITNISNNLHNVIIFILLGMLVLILIKDQIFIDEDQYLSSMIENEQKGIDYSNKIKEKTKNNIIKNIADKIITNNKINIIEMKKNIKNFRPLFKL